MKIKMQWLVVLALSGCSVAKEQFDCKYSAGIGCRSITEVNKMVTDGTLGSTNTINPKVSVANSKVTTLNAEPIAVKRVTEQYLRVWLAPFEDSEGHFHEDAIIHTVLRPGCWQIAGG